MAEDHRTRGHTVKVEAGHQHDRVKFLEDCIAQFTAFADRASDEDERAEWQAMVERSGQELDALNDTTMDRIHIAMQYEFEAEMIEHRLAELS